MIVDTGAEASAASAAVAAIGPVGSFIGGRLVTGSTAKYGFSGGT